MEEPQCNPPGSTLGQVAVHRAVATLGYHKSVVPEWFEASLLPGAAVHRGCDDVPPAVHVREVATVDWGGGGEGQLGGSGGRLQWWVEGDGRYIIKQ